MLNDAKRICLNAIDSCLPEKAVLDALKTFNIEKDVYLLAVGKAAYKMAKAASEVLNIKKGYVISKYGHIQGKLNNIECFEAGHPILDENSIRYSKLVVDEFSNLKDDDVVVFLLSGGASSLFELPIVELNVLQNINNQMLKKGLDIHEINTIRKRLSKIKGGRFANICEPARIYSIILSDVLDDRLDMIGSGPTATDYTSIDDALKIIDKYQLNIDDDIIELMKNNSNFEVTNCENTIIGSVKILCENAKKEAEKLGYKTYVISDQINMNCIEAGNLLFKEIKKHINDNEDVAVIMAGETTVNVKGDGLGGRNQELVFSQIENIKGLDNVLIMSLGSDGTDGPTDAAGAYIDGSSYQKLLDKNINYKEVLNNNDTYHGLDTIDSLIKTGPTGTNVNDITIALIKSR